MASRFQRSLARQEETANGVGWLTTFNDLITLLMVFFVLLFTMGSLDAKRFKSFQNALQSAMGVLYEGQHAPVGRLSEQSSSVNRNMPEGVGRTAQDNQDQFDALAQTRGLEAVYTTRGIQLTLDDQLLFSSGKAALTAEGKKLLGQVAAIIGPLDRNIRVEGHTDNVPISTGRYPSNWELSIARAIAVVNQLIQPGGIEPQRLSAAGYADSKPRAANDTPANRSKNRRVEIILGPETQNSK